MIEKYLTIIISIETLEEKDNLKANINYCLENGNSNKNLIDFVLLDLTQNSLQAINSQNIIKEISQELSLNYFEKLYKNLSNSHAKNLLVSSINSKYIMFVDSNFAPYSGFFEDILNEIKVSGLENYCDEFLLIPLIKTTKKGKKLFLETDEKLRKSLFLQKILEDDKEYLQEFSPLDSIAIYNRHNFLVQGGFDFEYEDIGFETIELNYRLMQNLNKISTPKTKFTNKSLEDILKYNSWEDLYSLYTDILLKKSLICFSFDEENSFYTNKQKFIEKAKIDFNKNKNRQILPDLNRGKTLYFTRTNAFIYNKQTLPLFGKLYYLDEDLFSVDEILSYIEKNSINRVLMFNPFATEKRVELSNTLREKNIELIIAERGALRDSVFFDYSGFNAQSKSYDAKYWDKELNENQIKQVFDYINEEKNLNISLEKQIEKIGKNRLKDELGIKENQKILFVPLQRPNDTVITYFCGKIQTYDNFLNLVEDVAKNIDSSWKVVVKKHPLEDEVKPIENIIYSSHNIKDLLESSDALLLINSGVGLLAMLWEKPVFYCGEVFYGDDRINKNVTTKDELFNHLKNNFKPNKDTIYKYLYYLLEEFYSFGNFTTKEISWQDSGRMTLTTDIDFYKIRNIIDEKINFSHYKKPKISYNSPLFDRYKNSLAKNSNKTILLLTHIDFWNLEMGSHQRVFALINYLQNHYKVKIGYLRDISRKEKQTLEKYEFDISYITYLKKADESLDKVDKYLDENPILKPFYKEDLYLKMATFIKSIEFDTVIVEYLQFSYFLPLFENKTKILDTHDIMYKRAETFRKNNQKHWIDIDKNQEFKIFKFYDRVLAIQKEENSHLLINGINSLYTPHPVKIGNLLKLEKQADKIIKIVFIGGYNIPNKESIEWFIRHIWRYIKNYSNIKLCIYGKVTQFLINKNLEDENIVLYGKVEDLNEVYNDATIAINPVKIGGGLKIKNIEALSFQTPLITTKVGSMGLESEVNISFLEANTIDEWINSILILINYPQKREDLAKNARNFIEKDFNEDISYKELITFLKEENID